MKIGKTNAVTILGGGTSKSDYELWQEGFGVDWDSVIQNSPSAGVQPALHIYNKVDSIRHLSGFNTTITIVTYNPTTGIYRPVTVDENKNLFFEESDYFINSHDGMYYICVIYKAGSYWGNWHFRTSLPIVYSNTKFCTGHATDTYISLMNNSHLYPFLRGVDCYNPTKINLSSSLEHLTVSVYQQSIAIWMGDVSDTQVLVLKEFVEKAPVDTIFTMGSAILTGPVITDAKLADWFFNDFFYNNFNGTAYGSSGSASTKNVAKFKVNPNILLTGANQLRFIPNCSYLEGTFTENQTNDAASAGLHNGFRTASYTLLQNFPMWTVLDGATTGCLLPRPEGSNVSGYANFIFHSTNFERKYFCEFDADGNIIEDPTKYFVCNLPFQQYVEGQTITFQDKNFKNHYTAEEQAAIVELVVDQKNWGLIW